MVPVFLLFYERDHCLDRDVGMELPAGTRDVERRLLPAKATEGLRRARVLCGALQHRRSQFDVLWPAAGRRIAHLGRANAARLRVLDQAVSEVHASRDV